MREVIPDVKPITVNDAVAKYGIDRKRLFGALWTNGFSDPIMIENKLPKDSGEILILDNWQLKKLAAKHQRATV